jgi:ATP-dependent exoDNAse (exonuclease V) alpha subunit
VLAPTGKAVLRITENIQAHTGLTDLEARTIDKFIFDNKFGDLYDDWPMAFNIPPQEKVTVENLIIDESSMLDLKKFAFLLSIIKVTEKYPKRIILVGDENQLPPIGFGKPFHDVIEYVQQADKYSANHYINLVSNCRQENDENILKLAEAFTEKTRGYEEAFNLIDSGEGKKSEGLFVYEWNNQEELNTKIKNALNMVFDFEAVKKDEEPKDDFERLNLLYGLYPNGYVNNTDYKFAKTLNLERLQVLTPYRAGYFGTLGLNRFIQSNYRLRDMKDDKYFNHADKLIRLRNWYWGKGKDRKLVLSNGSIGVVVVGRERKYYFRDKAKPIFKIDDEENFDLAYTITVHRSQGSDFKNVFMVVPQKQTLLSKELLYTALTRSKYRLFIFVQKSEDNLLMKAKNNSHLLHRNTSIFKEPVDKKGRYFPEPGKEVASKIEFIIYKALQKSGLKFKHEEPLALAKRKYKIRPDFTIFLKDGKKIFWEHLGMLDTRKYYNDWLTRRKDYADHALEDALITTDDLNGVSDEKIDKLIENIRGVKLKITAGSKFSNHHYELY